MTYQEIQQQLDKSWRVFEPNRVTFLRQVLSWIGSPETTMRVIQIAGTNGKGSTGTMLREILLANHDSVGHFASPAVFDDREQIWLNGSFVSENDWVKAYETLQYVLRAHGLSDNALSYFEVWTLVALLVFHAHGVQYAIVEAGLGGLHDATHMLTSSTIIAYTEIGLDHQNILGATIQDIAQNKAGLMTTGAAIVSDLYQPENVGLILKTQAEKIGATWFEQQIDVQVEDNTTHGLRVKIDGDSYSLGLLGRFQARNLSVVWQILSVLEQHFSVAFASKTRQIGLARTHLIGRMQVNHMQRILWDGAHNIDAVHALIDTLNDWRLTVKPLLILGVLKDKNYRHMIDLLLPMVSQVISVTPENPRALSADDLATTIRERQITMPVTVINPENALDIAKQLRQQNQYIIVAGSFYTLRAVGGLND
ncbi:bifunctional folylpolyglutamate synthase/dihydrofolate synthase [Leuconostoc rapi]|uniref:bifunctional folylpolyglutamate synthase/dihydrofolate synthase n=1 Tax=Leuconostoc rapi TaxID=1406906 RepID=UPI00195D0B22|nr:cyanophycin synthetase [Leuconostoc rapi]MBM7435019.1 dihydrofolate synthase/folylpolyglutamate synthase [Leuconostoc rapi]